MKIVRVSGGLGNQLFQYAFARALGETSKDEVFLDLSTYGYEAAHNGFELEELFPVVFRVAAEKDIIRLGTRPKGPLSQVRRKYFTKKSHHIDKRFSYDPEVFRLSGDRYLEGWWQDERYFSCIADTLRQELKFIKAPGEKNASFIAGLRAAYGAEGLASLHVRRGDAQKNPDTWVCTEAYYRRAIDRLRATAREKSLHFLVFSDDLPWCREHLKPALDEATFVDWNRGADSWKELWLMSQCPRHIIANSTFSWWGAWLDPSPERIVLAPHPWSLAKPKPFEYYHYTFDSVVPESWIRVPIE
jgi:hypothetical protein